MRRPRARRRGQQVRERPKRVLASKKAIREFMDRPRRDLRKLKELSDARIEERMRALPIRPPVWDVLDRVQKICFLIGAKYGYAFLILDTGMGKTLLSCALLLYFREMGDVNAGLVLVPTRANKIEWAREVRKYRLKGWIPKDFTLDVLAGSSADKWAQLEEGTAYLTVETVGGFTRMVSDLKQKEKKNGDKVWVLVPNRSRVEKMIRYMDGVWIDESTTVKGGRSTIAWRVLKKMRDRVWCLFPMTGTPMGRDPTDLWAQSYLADKGEALGDTLSLFRAALFNQSEPDEWGAITYTFPKRNEAVLNRMLAHSAIEYEVDESDLPEVQVIPKFVTLPGEAMAHYQEAREALYKSKGNVQEMQNAFLKMRQISSGFVGYYDDEEGKRAQFEFPFNPKLEYLMALLKEIRQGPRYKRIVFCDFVFTGSMIERELKREGIPYARIWRGTKDIDAERDRFEQDDECCTLVLNNQMGGYGLNLQIARYGIYHEPPVSSILAKQTRRRFERQYSDVLKKFLYRLMVRDTMDEQIYRWHAEAGGLWQAVLRGRVRV